MSKFNETISTYLKDKNMESLKTFLSTASNIEILNGIKDLSNEDQVIVYRLLSKDTALYIFEQLDTSLQQQLLGSFTHDKAIEIIREMAPDDRVRLLDELPATVAKNLIASLGTKEREITSILMGYESQTAGRIMTTRYIRLQPTMLIKDALERVRISAKEEDKETIYTIYVTDEQRKLIGVLSLRELIGADFEESVENIMHEQVIKVSTDTDQEEVARLLQELDLLAIPVTDKEDRLVGIITIDDAVDILEEEATEDMFNKAGLSDLNRKEANRSEVLVNGSIWEIWKVRIPFLVITLFGGLLAGAVIANFEETLGSVAAVAVFIPIIMDMGGNVGTQSSTVFTRGFLLGHIRAEKIWKHILREAGIGLSIGVLVGSITGVLAALWQGIPELGWAVGLALVSTMTLATFLGFLVPYVLIRLNIDQAAGTDPLITSIKDITGLLFYFLLVNYFLGFMLPH